MKNSTITKFSTKTERVPKAPPGLQKLGRSWWRWYQNEYGISDPGGQMLLGTICKCEDDLERMRQQVAKDGDVLLDRFGQRVAHPLLAAIRGCETVKQRALRGLNLEADLPAKVGRPTGVPNRK